MYVGETDEARIVIEQDEDFEPRECAVSKLYFWKDGLGDKHDFSRPKDMWLAIAEKIGYKIPPYNWKDAQLAIHAASKGKFIIKPVYCLDHSGVTISTTPYSDPWDSCQIGYAVISYEDLRKEYGENITEDTDLEVKGNELIDAEVHLYDIWLQGDIWEYTLYAKDICPCCKNISYREIDSGTGFLGTDWEKNGLKESIPTGDRDVMNNIEWSDK